MSLSDINNTVNNEAGKAQESQGMSLATFLASLSSSGIFYVAIIAIFFCLKNRLRDIYQPRVLPYQRCSNSKRNTSILGLSRYFDVPQTDWKGETLDDYLLVRFPLVIGTLFLILSCILLPVLIPLNYINGKGEAGGVTGLDQISWVNIEQHERYWAHLCCALIVVGITCHMIRCELNQFIDVRQSFLLSDSQVIKPVHSTILVTNIPKHLLDPEKLRQHYQELFGAVIDTQIILNSIIISSEERQRRKLILKLEKLWTEQVRLETRPQAAKRLPSHQGYSFGFFPGTSRSLPTHDHGTYIRKFLEQLRDLDQIVLSAFSGPRRQSLQTHAAFILFENPVVAHTVCQLSMGARPGQMMAHLICKGVSDVFTQNLNQTELCFQLRRSLVLGAVMILTVLWIIPISFTGCMSQLSYLSDLLPITSLLNSLPAPVQGMIQGILPPVLLSAIMKLFPVILRPLLSLSGFKTAQALEIDFQDHYFAFLFLQVFLTVSISSGLTTVIPQILKNTSSVTSILAQNLPKACNYFFSFLLLQASANSALTLLQAPRLVKTILQPNGHSETARQLFEKATDLPTTSSSTVFAYQSNMACIVLIYCVIAPIILPLGGIAFIVL